MALATAAAGAFAVPASAAPIVVLDTNFDVDEKLGRVRLAVDLYDESFEGNRFSESVVVPGLTFDRERREVLYEAGGSTVTCAVRKKFLWATTYEASGACRIMVRSEPRTADDGFGTRAVTGWVVELATDEIRRAEPLRPPGRFLRSVAAGRTGRYLTGVVSGLPFSATRTAASFAVTVPLLVAL